MVRRLPVPPGVPVPALPGPSPVPGVHRRRAGRLGRLIPLVLALGLLLALSVQADPTGGVVRVVRGEGLELETGSRIPWSEVRRILLAVNRDRVPRQVVSPGDRVSRLADGTLLLEASLARGEFLDSRYGELLLGRLNLLLPPGADVRLNGRPVDLAGLPRSRAALARFDAATGRVGRLEVVDPSPGGPGGAPWSVGAGLRPGEAAPERPLRAGETLHLELRAPAGGAASWDLAGVAWGLPGREVSPGRYQGAFRVPAGLDARRTFVLGRYRRDGVERPVRVGPSVSLAPSPPRLLESGPRGQAGARPALFARYESAGADVDATRVRLELDGRDVTRPARRTGDLVFYEPPEPLSPGPHRVRLEVRDTALNRRVWTWSFEVSGGG